jgi:BioD-like phosphotransacetylase family protein
VIVNKVLPEKLDFSTEFAKRGLKRKGLDLLGVLPYRPVLSSPTIELIREELGAARLNDVDGSNNIVESIVVGAMSPQNALRHFKSGSLVITPADRDDLILAIAAALGRNEAHALCGLILTGDLQPSAAVAEAVKRMPFPVLQAPMETYQAASKVHDVTVKTRPDDTTKISVIRDLIAQHVDVERIIQAL